MTKTTTGPQPRPCRSESIAPSHSQFDFQNLCCSRMFRYRSGRMRAVLFNFFAFSVWSLGRGFDDSPAIHFWSSSIVRCITNVVFVLSLASVRSGALFLCLARFFSYYILKLFDWLGWTLSTVLSVIATGASAENIFFRPQTASSFGPSRAQPFSLPISSIPYFDFSVFTTHFVYLLTF